MTFASLDVNEAIGSAAIQPSTATISACDRTSKNNVSDASSANQRNLHVGQHQDLHKLSVVNCDTLTEIVPNTEPVAFDNDCFSGYVQLLVRTPDVDCGKEEIPTLESAQRTSKYLKNFKRRFEFQFQIKLSE